MNEPNLPSFPEKNYIEKEIPSVEIADSILEHGITKKGGKYYIKIPYNDVLTTVTLSEESIDSLYKEFVLPRFLEISSSFTDAFLSYIAKNGQDTESERQSIVTYFKGLIGLLDLIEKNPRLSYDMRDMHNKCEKFLRFAFEYESKYESSTSPLIDSIYGKHGHYLLSYLVQHQILPQNYFDIDKRFLHLSLILQEHSIEELVDYNKKGYISSETLTHFLSVDDLLAAYRSTKKIKYLKAISCEKLLGLYLNGDISPFEIKEAKITQKDFYNMILAYKISPNDLEILADDINFEALFPNADKLYELYNKNALGGKTILKFVSLGKVKPETIPSIYASEQFLQNAIIVPQSFDESYLTTIEDFIETFSIEFMLRLEEAGDFSPELVDFYKSNIVPTHKGKQIDFYEKRRKNLEQLEITSSNLPTILLLVEKGIFSIDDITALDIEETGLPLSDISYKGISILYSAGKIPEINLLDIPPAELINCWKNNLLIENALEILSPTDFIESYSKGQLDCKDLLHIYDTGKIELIDLDCLSQIELQDAILEMHILSDNKEEEFNIKERAISPKSIAELFLKQKIDYDTFRKLYDEGKISKEVYDKAIEDYDIESEMKKIRQLSSIENIAMPEGSIIPTSPSPLPGPLPTTKKVSIDPELRNEFLEALGCESSIPISTGALKGYMFIPIPSLKTAVLEKLYNTNSRTGALTPALDNATFVLPLIKALELATSSNKTDLRKLDNVHPVNHTKGWAKNILSGIKKGNPSFEYKRYKEDYSDLIELIAQNYIENRGE